MKRADRLLRKSIRTRFLVTTTDGEAFEGLVFDVDAENVVLCDVEAVTEAERTKVDGHLWIPRPRVAYMQQPRL